MLKIILHNGKKIYGKGWQELVEGLKNDTQYYETTAEEYMKQTADRHYIISGKKLVYHDEESFIKALEKANVLKIQRGNKNGNVFRLWK